MTNEADLHVWSPEGTRGAFCIHGVTAGYAIDPALRRARELLDDDPAANSTLEQLAAVAGASRHRITRLFHAAYGVPPHRYQLARRLGRARCLLERGVPIARAATLTGFFDQSHLHRHFRRAFGFTPARYVALVRSGVQDTTASRDLDSPSEARP